MNSGGVVGGVDCEGDNGEVDAGATRRTAHPHRPS
jgi:hypothetical protein